MRPVRILRVDPYRRTVAAMSLKGAKDATPQLRKLARAKNVSARKIMEVEGGAIMVVSGLDIDEAEPMWRFPGTEDTAGVGIITGQAPNGRVIHTPVTAEWALTRIQWLPGEDVSQRDARAEETLPLLNDEIRRAVREAIVLPEYIWISGEDKAVVGEAMITLGLGDERTGGQRLTPLGERIHDMLITEGM